LLLVGVLVASISFLGLADRWALDEQALVGPVRTQDLLLLAVLGTLVIAELLFIILVLGIRSATEASGQPGTGSAVGNRAQKLFRGRR
jgi:hypothetical protein